MRRIHYLIVALFLLLGTLAFGIIGFITARNTPEATEINDYGMMSFYVYSFGYGTAFDDQDTKKDTKEDADTDTTMQYVEYRNEDGRFSFVREVSNDEYMDFQIARENEGEHRPVQRYVYTYRLNGELQTIIQEQQLSDNQLREIIGNTNKVSAWQYFVFAGLLLVVGAYFLYLAFRPGKRKGTIKTA